MSDHTPSSEQARKIVVDLRGRDYVCPECGGRVDQTESQRRDTAVATARPCGHEISLGQLRPAFPPGEEDDRG